MIYFYCKNSCWYSIHRTIVAGCYICVWESYNCFVGYSRELRNWTAEYSESINSGHSGERNTDGRM